MTDGWRRGGGALGALCAVVLITAGCGKSNECVGSACVTPTDPNGTHSIVDGGTGRDAGVDSGTDGGHPDAGQPVDGGEEPDAGRPDAGLPDAGTDAGSDAGTITFGGPGPWPMKNVIYGAAEGIQGDVVGMSTDETQNLWVATTDALYLLKPGETTFHKYTSQDGLHLQDNPMKYCNDEYNKDASPLYPGWICKYRGSDYPPLDGYGTGISTIVGGGPNEVLVGYHGIHDWSSPVDSTNEDPFRHTGMVDRVRLRDDGSVEVMRFDLNASNDLRYWHDREIERMVYDHFHHPHALYVGTEHGVTLLMPDRLRYPNPKTDTTPPEYWHNVNYEFMADHLHAHVCITEGGCGDGEAGQRMGDWRGLAIAPDGDLWTAGRWTAGKITWNANIDPDGTKNIADWSLRSHPSTPKTFDPAFGDPYPGSVNACGQANPPVFEVAKEGDVVSLTAVTVTPDGTVWFASGKTYGDDVALGLAAYKDNCFHYFSPSQAGLAEQNVKDLVALPDGRLVVAGPTSGLSLWNPATGAHHPMNAGNHYLPDNQVQRLELDTMVEPPALHVATATGAATIRQFPQD
jgi:hypothetical protein